MSHGSSCSIDRLPCYRPLVVGTDDLTWLVVGLCPNGSSRNGDYDVGANRRMNDGVQLHDEADDHQEQDGSSVLPCGHGSNSSQCRSELNSWYFVLMLACFWCVGLYFATHI